MRFFFLCVVSLFFMKVAFACEIQPTEKTTQDKAAKVGKEGGRLAPCDSLQNVMAMYGKKISPGGRRLESAEPVSLKDQEDSLRNICKNPQLSKKLIAADSITDSEVRMIVTAAILDGADEYVARDMVLNNEKVKPCISSKP